MNQQKNSLILGITIGLLMALIIGGIYFFINNKQANNRSSVEQQASKEKTPVVIYTEETSKTEAKNRSWPTVNIYKKTGTDPSAKPELLTSNIGKVGEYPNSFTLSPDKKSLFINLESKLQKLDLATKNLTDFFTPKKQIQSFIISEDGKRMYIWDQIYAASDDYEYALHQIDLTANTSTILKEGTLPDGTFIFINHERSDGILTLSQALGEAWHPWYFDLKTKELQKMQNTYPSPWLSESDHGKYLMDKASDVPTICNDFFGALPSTYDILSIPEGKKIDSFGTKGQAIDILGYNKDDTEVLFATYPSLEKSDSSDYSEMQKQCQKYDPPKTYYRLKIGTGTVTPVSDHRELLASWGKETSNFEMNYRSINSSQSQYVISYKGKDLFLPGSNQSVVEVFEEE